MKEKKTIGMEFRYEVGCGRSVVATRDYAPGEVIHCEEAYALCSIHGPSQTNSKKKQHGHNGASIGGSSCLFCFNSQPRRRIGSSGDAAGDPDLNHKRQCQRCLFWYCSADCESTYAAQHYATGECAALAATEPLRPVIPKEDFNTFQVVCVTLARAKSEFIVEASLKHGDRCDDVVLPSWMRKTCDAGRQQEHSDVETVGLGFEGPLPSLEELLRHSNVFGTGVSAIASSGDSTEENVPVPLVPKRRFQVMERLVTNRSVIDPEIVKDYAALYPKYEQLFQQRQSRRRKGEVACGSETRDESVAHSSGAPDHATDLQTVASPWWRSFLAEHASLDVFLALCCAFQANGFGVWKANGQAEAAGFFPCSSFFNHSCSPNIGREMNGRMAVFFAAKPIRAGEAIQLCYIDFKLSREERQAKLLATYSFRCRCARCDDPEAIDHRDRYDLPLCGDCKAKILRPMAVVRYGEESRRTGRCPCCRQEFPLE